MKEEKGQDLVEFALIAPVLFLLLLGIMEFGVAVWRYNTIANAAREGARAALVLDLEDRRAEAEAVSRAFAESLGLDGSLLQVDYHDGTRTVGDGSHPAQTVEVTLTYTYTGITGLFWDMTMQAHSTMLAEKPDPS